MLRLERRDRIGRIVLTDAPPSAAQPATAKRTPEGYLQVRGLLARDGCLEYSDGKTAWNEYRPSAELKRGAPTFAGKPVTNDHPPVMLDASTWRDHACGTIGDSVAMHTGPTGIQYMAANLLVQDADLIEAIEGGKVELSIGFTATVIDSVGVAPDGTPYTKVQTDLYGNHVSAVDEGRAGPECRILLDGAACTTSPIQDSLRSAAQRTAAPRSATQRKAGVLMGQQVDPKKPKGKAAPARKDTGMPVEEVEIMGPLGEPVTVPTWLAAAWEKLKGIEAGMPTPAMAAPAPEAAAVVAPDALPAPEVTVQQPGPAAAAPATMPPKPEEDEADPEEKSLDSAIAKRMGLIADAVEILGRTDDMHTKTPTELRRAVVKHVMPTAKVDDRDGDYLQALYDMAVAQHRSAATTTPRAPRKASPWEDEPVTRRRDSRSPADVSRAKYLAKFGRTSVQ
jgi:hypothetical protein